MALGIMACGQPTIVRVPAPLVEDDSKKSKNEPDPSKLTADEAKIQAAFLQSRKLDQEEGPQGRLSDDDSKDDRTEKEITDLEYAPQRGSESAAEPHLYGKCYTRPFGESEVKEMTDLGILFDSATVDVIYPGATILGGNGGLEQGLYTPFLRPRAPGEFVVTNLNFSGTEARYTFKTKEVNLGSVYQGIQDTVNTQEVAGTGANLDFQLEQVYDEKDIAFKLGVGVRGPGLKVSGSLKIDKEKKRNYFLMRFRQVYFTVAFVRKTSSPSEFFKDGYKLSNENGDISKDNPILYVSSVNYGRVIYLLAETVFSKTQIEAAVKASIGWGIKKNCGTKPTPAAGTPPANQAEIDEWERNCGVPKWGVGVNTSLSHKEIMNKTNISFVARGGPAEVATEAIQKGSGSASSMFEAVRDAIGNKLATNYSIKSPASIVSYNLRYLKNGDPASMSFNSVSDRTFCSYRRAYAPRVQFALRNAKENIALYTNAAKDPGKAFFEWNTGSRASSTPLFDIPLNPVLEGQTKSDTVVSIQGNHWCSFWKCFDGSAQMDVYVTDPKTGQTTKVKTFSSGLPSAGEKFKITQDIVNGYYQITHVGEVNGI